MPNIDFMSVTLPFRLHRGVLNVVHGSRDVVNMICDHPDIKAISFVGSNQAGKYIYKVRP